MNEIEVGKRIKTLRNTNGLTQQTLAEKLDYSIPFISYLENGKATLTLNVVLDLATYFGVSLDYLLFGDSKNDPLEVELISLLKNASREEKELMLEINTALLPLLHNHM